MLKLAENDKEGRDYRSEQAGIDYDDVLREAVSFHIENNNRTVHDVALSLRLEEAWLQRWLVGEEEGTLYLLSALCANVGMTPSDVFSYSPSYASEASDVTEFKDLLVKRLAHAWSESDLLYSITVANMLMEVPVAEEGITQGVKLAMKIAEQFGYDTRQVRRGLERVKGFQRQTGNGAGPKR